MEVDKLLLRHYMLYEFQKAIMQLLLRNPCKTLGQNVVDLRTVQKWSAKIRSEDFNLKVELQNNILILMIMLSKLC